MAPIEEESLTDAVLKCRKDIDDKAREEKEAAEAKLPGDPDESEAEPTPA